MAQINIDIKSELPKAIRWTDAHTKQLAFSVSQALNATSKGLRQLQGSKERSILSDLQRLSERQLCYTSPSHRDRQKSRMPSSA